MNSWYNQVYSRELATKLETLLQNVIKYCEKYDWDCLYHLDDSLNVLRREYYSDEVSNYGMDYEEDFILD